MGIWIVLLDLECQFCVSSVVGLRLTLLFCILVLLFENSEISQNMVLGAKLS